MSAWGGTRRKVHGVLTGWTIAGLTSGVVTGLGRSVPVWGGAEMGGAMMSPWINGSNQAIWQAKVAPDVQGKVFSIRRLIAWFSTPLAALTAGPLADFVVEPAMRQGDSAAARVFGPLFGVEPGAGMALVISLCGLGMMAVGLGGYLFPAVRNAEELLPDHDAAASSPETEAGGEVMPAPSD
jgi:hypothetical protein